MKDIKLKDKIAQGINDLFYIWKREFQTTFRDQGLRPMLKSSPTVPIWKRPNKC